MTDDIVERRELNQRLEGRIARVEKDLAAHGEQLIRTSQAIASMKETSAERLEYIKDRFDELKHADDKILLRLEKRNQFGRWITNLALGVLFVVAGAINSMYLEPMTESIATIERRLLAVEIKTLPAPLEPK